MTGNVRNDITKTFLDYYHEEYNFSGKYKEVYKVLMNLEMKCNGIEDSRKEKQEEWLKRSKECEEKLRLFNKVMKNMTWTLDRIEIGCL